MVKARNEPPFSEETEDAKTPDLKPQETKKQEPPKTDNAKFPDFVPPKTKKSEVFGPAKYKYVADYVDQLPDDVVYLPISEAVQRITNHGTWKDEIANVRAIFLWMVSNNHLNVEPRAVSRGSASEYYWQAKMLPDRVAQLMTDFCKLADIPCVTVDGFEHVEFVDSTFSGAVRSHWNAVFVAGGWRLIDPSIQVYRVNSTHQTGWVLLETDGAATATGPSYLTIKVDEFNFLADPEDFVKMFLAQDERLQLVAEPVSMKQFTDSVLLKSQFFKLKMSFLPESKVEGTLIPNGSRPVICFGNSPTERYKFKYYFYGRGKAKADKTNDSLDRYVMDALPRGKVVYTIRPPYTGKFRLEVRGSFQEDLSSSPCFVYYMECSDEDEKSKPLPDNPPIGWGPSAVSEDLGVKPISHHNAEVNCPQGQVSIQLGTEKALEFQQILKHTEIEDTQLTDYSVMEINHQETTIHVRLPAEGEIGLKVFAHSLTGMGDAENAINYLLEGDQPSVPFPNVPSGVLGNHKVVTKAFNVKATPEPKSYWLTLNEPNIDLEFNASQEVSLVFELHTNDAKAATEMTCKVDRVGSNSWKVYLSLSVSAEYSFNVFTRREGDVSALYGAYSYLISTLGKDMKVAPAIEGRLVKRIPSETVRTQTNQVRIPLKTKAKNVSLTFEPRLGRATVPFGTTYIDYNQKQAIVTADGLEDGKDYIVNVYEENVSEHTVKNIARYKVIKTKEKEIPMYRLRRLARGINLEMIHEICSYNAPPNGVFPIMTSAFLFLGYPFEDFRSWMSMQTTLRGEKAETFLSRLRDLDPKKVGAEEYSISQRRMKRLYRSKYNVISPGAFNILLWVAEVLKLLERYVMI